MKTYSAFYLHEMGKPIFSKIVGSELFGKLPAGVRLINTKIKDLEEAGRTYQYFHDRSGSGIVVLEDKI